MLGQLSELSTRVTEYGGRVVKGTGDGLLITFDSPRRAVAFAVAAQQALAGSAPAVRIGLNTGEAEWHEDDPLGAAVNAAARITARAAGGEVLVSDVVRQLVTGTSTVVFRDRGRHRLRGFTDRWHLWAVQDRSTSRPGLGTIGRRPELTVIDEVLTAYGEGRGKVPPYRGRGGHRQDPPGARGRRAGGLLRGRGGPGGRGRARPASRCPGARAVGCGRRTGGGSGTAGRRPRADCPRPRCRPRLRRRRSEHRPRGGAGAGSPGARDRRGPAVGRRPVDGGIRGDRPPLRGVTLQPDRDDTTVRPGTGGRPPHRVVPRRAGRAPQARGPGPNRHPGSGQLDHGRRARAVAAAAARRNGWQPAVRAGAAALPRGRDGAPGQRRRRRGRPWRAARRPARDVGPAPFVAAGGDA